MNKLKLDEIEFGKIDAYNELLDFGPEHYLNSFFSYDKYHTSDFLSGRKYYICGNKGTGKTAFINYLRFKFAEDKRNLISIVRFKSEFDEEDKRNIASSENGQVEKNENDNIKDNIIDYSSDITGRTSYVLTWKMYFLNLIFSDERKGEYNIFKPSKELEEIKHLLRMLYSDHKNKISPQLRRGEAAVSASSIKGLSAELKIEVGFNESENKVNFNKTAKTILKLYNELEFSYSPTYVLIDELELSQASAKLKKRDIDLVRDLILAVYEFNQLNKEKDFNIHYIASIRSEVLNNINSYGYEINKQIEDYGITVEWFFKGGSHDDSPLIRIIENKIIASEIDHGLKPSTREEVWNKYFPKTVNGIPVKDYILSNTWQRPRDIIRMLTIVQNQYNGETVMTQEMFDRGLQEYSEKSWNEISEELILAFQKKEDIKAVKKFFTGIEVPFTYAYICQRAKELRERYAYIDDYFSRVSIIEFLEKMFEWGVIGNSGARMVFKFLGDRDLDTTSDMILHKPLRNLFAVRSRKK